MFKNIFKSISLFSLLIVNATLFTWYANSPNTENKVETFDKTIISKAEAKSATISTSPTMVNELKTPIIQKDDLSSFHIQSQGGTNSEQKIMLKFQSLTIQLDTIEESRLESLLKSLNINASYEVHISSGPMPLNDEIDSSQTAKLRAQAVARIIYPHTQKITMFYLPNLASGTVIIDVLQP